MPFTALASGPPRRGPGVPASALGPCTQPVRRPRKLLRAARTVLLAALVLAAGLAATPREAATAPSDKTARGLDAFLFVPGSAAPGSTLPVIALALGFPTLVTTTPLDGAEIVASWDPDTLDLQRTGAPVPAPVTVKTDEKGRATLSIAVPDGDPATLGLFVVIRANGKERQQTVRVERKRRDELELMLGDKRVVPGGFATAWALVRDVATGIPRANVKVEARLLEGNAERHRVEGTTDAGGTVALRIPIPRTREPSLSWQLVAREMTSQPDRAASATVELRTREETPGKPSMDATFDEPAVRPGARAAYRVRLHDASDEPVARTEVRVWTGPRNTNPPADEKGWLLASRPMTTTVDGEVRGELAAPAVVPAAGTDWKVVARAKVDGAEVKDETAVHVGRERASVRLVPEAGSVVPGVEQRLFLELAGEDARPLAGKYRVRGDGLDATVALDAHGQGEIIWKAPSGVGGFRGVGPCASDVAAAVKLEAADDVATRSLAGASMLGFDDTPLCVPVDRDAELLVRVEPPIARAGDKVHVSVRGAKGRGASVVATTDDGGRSVAAWAADGDAGVDLVVPAEASGLLHLDVAVPRKNDKALLASGAVLAVPGVLPEVTGKVIGGLAKPGATVTVEAVVSDGKGKGMPGTVAVVVIDRFGGGSLGGLHQLDTRGGLCASAGIESDRCSATLDPARAALPGIAPDIYARERVGSRRGNPGSPMRDPGEAVTEEAKKTFREVVHSLEGAVYEASSEPARLADVRRRQGAGWGFNPELLTLATAAMPTPPMTPGGEPIALADLISVDRQVTFDNVARRITRLKLYQVLQAIHDHRKSEGLLDPDEPALRDAGAMLRRLVRSGAITDAQLADPWGGRIQATKSQSQDGLPFLRPAPGWELRSPGPDGKLGNGDDVRDPFERVLDSATPYASAVDEDRIVDARLDMRVADATVDNWRALLEELTGTSLGGIELSGTGTGGSGSGQGFGSGSGRLGGMSRRSSAAPSGIAFWSGPRRTDASGVVRIEVPLGDIETTWRVGLIAVPDGARPAFSSTEVASKLPVSARVDLGARWVEGDRVGAAIIFKNRTAAPVEATLSVRATGGVVLDGASPTRATIPAQGSTTVRIPLRGARPGKGALVVRTSAPGVDSDELTHEVEIERAGEELVVSRAALIESSEVDLGPALEREGLVGLGPATLVLERADAGVLRAAVDSLDPDDLVGDADLADAADVGRRVAVWATARFGEKSALVEQATRLGTEAIGRLVGIAADRRGHAYPSVQRAARWAEPDGKKVLGAVDDCPKEGVTMALPRESAIDLLDAEPALETGAMKPCWGAYVGNLLTELQKEESPARTARAIASLAERRHRAEDVRVLTTRLASLVGLRASGAIALDDPSRATRSLVYSALLRAPPRTLVADRGVLVAWLLVQRDARGGFGSSTATRAAVRALLAPGGALDEEGVARAVVSIDGDERRIDVATGKPQRIALAPQTTSVTVDGDGSAVFARVERRFLRPFRSPSTSSDASLAIAVRWPQPKVGDAAPVRVIVSQTGSGKRLVDVRVPLPPGAHLAAPVGEVREVQGHLLWRTVVGDTESFVEVPVRFDLAVRATIAEATISDARGGGEPARAPARPFVVTP